MLKLFPTRGNEIKQIKKYYQMIRVFSWFCNLFAKDHDFVQPPFLNEILDVGVTEFPFLNHVITGVGWPSARHRS